MKIGVLVIVGLCLLVAGAAQAGARTSCSSTYKRVGGTQTETFCGPAKATVHDGSKVIHYSHGNCVKIARAFEVQIGTIVLGTTKKSLSDYLEITISPPAGKAVKDGVYMNATILGDHGGKPLISFGVNQRVVLLGGQQRGSFSETGVNGSPKISGTFTCR